MPDRYIKRRRHNGHDLPEAEVPARPRIVSRRATVLPEEPEMDVQHEQVDIKLRLARPEDLDALVALDALCFSTDFLFGKSLMQALVETANSFTLIAETPSAELAGFAIAHCKQEHAPEASYLVTLDVAPHLRRCGIATRLLRSIERRMIDHHSRRLDLHVYTGNLAAIRFYERRGFERGLRLPQFYGALGDRDAFLYTRQLS